jgi:hypothetical protein
MLKTSSAFALGLASLAVASFVSCIEVTQKDLAGSGCKVASFESTPATDKGIGIGDSYYGGSSLAQSFMATSEVNPETKTASPSVAVVLLRKKGDFKAKTHNLIATIEGNGTSSSGPDSKPLVVSDPIDVASISSTQTTFVTFKFRSKPELKESVVYWLRIKATYPVNSENFVVWESYEGQTGGYTHNDIILNAMYEHPEENHFATSLIGMYRFMIFRLGC